MKKYGDEQLGVKTPDPRTFKTWDDMWEAYKAQQDLFLRATFTQQYIVTKVRAEHFAQPMGSALHDLCMKYCLDLHTRIIPEGANFGYFEFMMPVTNSTWPRQTEKSLSPARSKLWMASASTSASAVALALPMSSTPAW